MLSRATLPFALVAIAAAAPVHADHPKGFAADFGLATPIFALGNVVEVTYYGWEETTFYGHTLWAFTAAQYEANRTADCYTFLGCGTVLGTSIATKPHGEGGSPYLPGGVPGPQSVQFGWTAGTEIIFAIMVNQLDGYNWFFSGSPARNGDGLAHLAYFDPLLYPEGVPGDDGLGVVPQTAGLHLFGFEDVHYEHSDWDFDNLLFAVDHDSINPPNEVVPEPASMALVATGLAAMAAAGRRRRRGAPPES